MFRLNKDNEGHRHIEFKIDGQEIIFTTLIAYLLLTGIPQVKEEGLKSLVEDFWCGESKECLTDK